ncbi:MAG: protease inhibitor Inh/omp19 family protein [Nitratireductor sp.]|nr:protease inhibitor Inh/omp19 family protein [Nitratireductor sp.]
MKTKTLVALTVASLAIAGCTRSVNNTLNPGGVNPQRLPSAPVQPVQDAGQLPPPQEVEPGQEMASVQPMDPTNPGMEAPSVVDQTGAAETAPQPSAEPVTREGVSGTWIVASDNSDCRLILAFTKWSGGYRAASRKCVSPEISSVGAWDVKGQQVVLLDNGGNTVARLYRSGGERYDGTTNSGKPISFTR